jgi:hypothetical protein
MLVQQSLFDSNESSKGYAPENEAFRASHAERKIIGPGDAKRKPTHRELVGLIWQMCVFLTNVSAVLSSIIRIIGPVDKAWDVENLVWMTGAFSALLVAIVLVVRNPVLVPEIYRLEARLFAWLAQL